MPDLTRNRSAWLWQFDGTAERTIEALAATCRDYAETPIILVKAMDGGEWMRDFDTAPDAITSVAKMQETIARGAAAGATVIPWVNVTSPANAPEHADLGPSLVVDAEPYRGFFENGTSPTMAADFQRYLQGLRAGGVEQLYVSMDPRPTATQALGVPSWANLVDGLLPQFYWTDFGTAPDSPLMVSYVQNMAALGIPIVPVLPENGTAGDMARFWAITGNRFAGVSLWRLGAADAAHLREFAAIPVVGDSPTPAPTPPPAPPPDDTRIPRAAALLQQALAILAEPLPEPDPAPAPSSQWVKPLDSYFISQGYGPTDEPLEPIINGVHFHQGIDLAAPLNTLIYSACEGTVLETPDQGNQHLGRSIVIQCATDPSIVVHYGHCQEIDCGPGGYMRAGQWIGKVGNTGASTGPHLHFQVERDGVPINPAEVIAL